MALTHFLPEDSYYHGILAATEILTAGVQGSPTVPIMLGLMREKNSGRILLIFVTLFVLI